MLPFGQLGQLGQPGLAPFGCKAAAFVQRRCLAMKGHHRMVWWRLNKLSSSTLRDVALRAIGLTGASALRLGGGCFYGKGVA